MSNTALTYFFLCQPNGKNNSIAVHHQHNISNHQIQFNSGYFTPIFPTSQLPDQPHSTTTSYNLFSNERITILLAHTRKISNSLLLKCPQGSSALITERAKLRISNYLNINECTLTYDDNGEIMVTVTNTHPTPYTVNLGM